MKRDTTNNNRNAESKDNNTRIHSVSNEVKECKQQTLHPGSRYYSEQSDLKAEEQRAEERKTDEQKNEERKTEEQKTEEQKRAELRAEEQRAEEWRSREHALREPSTKTDYPDTEIANSNRTDKYYNKYSNKHSGKRFNFKSEDAKTDTVECSVMHPHFDKQTDLKNEEQIPGEHILQISITKTSKTDINTDNKELKIKESASQNILTRKDSIPNNSKPTSGALSYHYLSDDLKGVIEEVGRTAKEAVANSTNGDELKNGYDNAKNAAEVPLNVVEAVLAQAMLTKYLHGDGKRAVRDGNKDILFSSYGIDPVAKTSMDEMRIYARSTDLTELGLMKNKYDYVIKDRDKMQARLDQLNSKDKLKISERQEIVDLQKRITEMNYDIDAITSGQAYNRKQYAKLIKKIYDVDIKEGDLYTPAQSVVTLKTLKDDGYITVKDKNNRDAEYKIPLGKLPVRDYAVSGQSFVAKNAEEACRFSDAEYAAKASFISAKQKISKVCNESWALRYSGINNMTPRQIKAEKIKCTISLTEADVKAGISLEAKVLKTINSTRDDRNKALMMVFNGANLINGKVVMDSKTKEQAEALFLFKSSIEKHFDNIDNGVYGAARGLANNAEHAAQESDMLQGYKLSSKPAKSVRSGLRTKWFIQKNKHLVKRSLMEKKLKSDTFKTQKDKKLFQEKYDKLYGETGKWTKKEKQHLIRQQRTQDVKNWAPRQARKFVNKGLNSGKAVIMGDDGTDLLGIRKRYAKINDITRKAVTDNAASRTLRYGSKKGAKAVKTTAGKAARKVKRINIPARKKAQETAVRILKKIGVKAGNLIKTIAANYMQYVGFAVMLLGIFTLLGAALIGISRSSFIETILRHGRDDLKNTLVNELDEYNKAAKKARNSSMDEIFSVFTDVYEPKRIAYDETYWLAQREPELRNEVDSFEANVWSNIASRVIDGRVYSSSSPQIENDNGIFYYKVTRDNHNASVVSGIMSALLTLTTTQNSGNTPFNPFVFEKIALVDTEGDEEYRLLAGYTKEEVIDESIFTKKLEEIDENTSSDDIDAIIAKELNKSMYFDTKFDANGHVTEEGIRVSDFSSNELMEKQIDKYVGLIKYCMKDTIEELEKESPTADTAKKMYDAILSNVFIKAGFNLSEYDSLYFEGNYVNYFNKYVICEHTGTWTDTGKTKEYTEKSDAEINAGRKYTVKIYICDICGEKLEGEERTWLECSHEWQEVGVEKLKEHDDGGEHSGKEYTVKKYLCKKCSEIKYGSERTWLDEGNDNILQENNSQHGQEQEEVQKPSSTSKPTTRPELPDSFKLLD